MHLKINKPFSIQSYPEVAEGSCPRARTSRKMKVLGVTHKKIYADPIFTTGFINVLPNIS